MINIRFLIYTAVIFLLSFDHTNAQSLSQNDQKELNQLLHMQAAAQDIPGMVIMVANKKKVIYKSAVGFNSISNRDTLLIDDIFNIASMTKAITSVVIMQLYEQGRIGLDDEAKKYLPEIGGIEVISNFNTTDTSFTTRPVVHPITIRQLLTHTSGIGYPFCNDTLALISQKKKTAQSGNSYLDFPLLHEPGIYWTYGMSTDVLGDIIERITDTSIDKYYNEKVFKPLGMVNTFYTVPTNKYNRLTNFYDHVNGEYKERLSNGTDRPAIKGGSGLYSTAEDYTKFLQMLLNK